MQSCLLNEVVESRHNHFLDVSRPYLYKLDLFETNLKLIIEKGATKQNTFRHFNVNVFLLKLHSVNILLNRYT